MNNKMIFYVKYNVVDKYGGYYAVLYKDKNCTNPILYFTEYNALSEFISTIRLGMKLKEDGYDDIFLESR